MHAVHDKHDLKLVAATRKFYFCIDFNSSCGQKVVVFKLKMLIWLVCVPKIFTGAKDAEVFICACVFLCMCVCLCVERGRGGTDSQSSAGLHTTSRLSSSFQSSISK